MRVRSIILGLVATAVLGSLAAASDWPTYGHDPQRSGQAAQDSLLNVHNVQGLKLQWKSHIDNQSLSMAALTAPLVAGGVHTPDGVKTLVYVAGSSNGMYALDAATGQVVWSVKLPSDVNPVRPGMWLCPNNLNDTPTIDASAGVIYVIGSDGRLFGLDLATGKTTFGPYQFVPAFSKNWSLTLDHGVIYTSISQGCGGAQSGIYSMDVRDPHRPVVRNLLINSGRWGSGIWGRGGLLLGSDGLLYAGVGDGPMDTSKGAYGSAVMAVHPPDLNVVDYYAPADYQMLTQFDLDLGSTTPAWIPDHGVNLLATGGKGGTLYLLNAASLGGEDHHTPLQTLRLSNDQRAFEEYGIWGSISTWQDPEGNNWIYVPVWGAPSKDAPKFPLTNGPAPDGSIMAFRVVRDSHTRQPVLAAAWISSDFNRPDPAAIENGVVFAISTGENAQQTFGDKVKYHGQKQLSDAQRGQDTHRAVLYAMDASTGKVLYSSGNAISGWVHFSGLAIEGDHIFVVDHDSNLYCFGLNGR